MSLPLPVLLQISDSAFPTGAFAYSNGLETLARAGRFPKLAALEEYLDTMLRQACDFDLAFVAGAHATADAVPFDALCQEWDATFWNHPIRTASLRQGRALIDVLHGVFPVPGLGDLRAQAERRGEDSQDLHFAIALGRSFSILGSSREEACWVYLHGLIRDQAAAAVRLGLTGPRTAQMLQAHALDRATAHLGDMSRVCAPREARRSAPLIETGQGGHAFLYSRLFQN